jgi:transcription antitermination factor NusA-like protein
VSSGDFEIARLLLSLEEKYPSLQDVYFHKAVETSGVLAIVVKRGDVPRLLGYGGKIIKALGKKTGKTIRVLEYGADERKFLEDLFVPMRILTINTIWLPDGTTETRVILKSARARARMEALKKIAQKVRGITLRVEFSR